MATVTACPGGLSPLARGTPPLRSSTRSISRFIPAGAGNSNTTANKHDVIRVYPRWRGELFPRDCDRHRPIGLSPLARGTLLQRRTADGLARFIPAGAGNSGTGPALTGGGSVYPRWRGELRSGEQHNNSVPGLSAYSALFDHGLASKSDQRFAYIRSTGNLTFSTAF